MSRRIKRIFGQFNSIQKIESFNVIGDPGCDGLGATAMSLFACALNSSSADFTIVAGDIVHRGIESLYRSVTRLVDIVAPHDVYMLCGNHDTAYYDEYFGLRNYIIYDDRTLIIVLDDAARRLGADALELLSAAVSGYERENIVIILHIPPPNSVSTNSLSAEEWDKLLRIITPVRSKVKYIVSGHLHSYFEEMLEGTKLIVTGGGGADIEEITGLPDKGKAVHHMVSFYYEGDVLKDKFIPVVSGGYDRELADPVLKESLEKAFVNEAVAHFKYKLYASDAEQNGLPGIAKMFRAFSDSEFYHARNHFFVLGRMGKVSENMTDSMGAEQYEIEKMYSDFLEYSRSNNHGLSEYSFMDSFESEKVHYKAVQEALTKFSEGNDVDVESYFTCTSCGYTFKGVKEPINCPVCGAPSRKIKPVL